MKHRTAYQKATAKIEKEGQKQCFLAYGAAGIALWRQGKRHTAITRLFEVTQDVWEECANNIKCSMILRGRNRNRSTVREWEILA